MATITQDMRYRLSLIEYAEKYGVTKAAIKYKTNRQYIYRWKRRYDGSIESLRDLSRRPHHHPNQHTPEEIKLINDMRRRNPDAGLVVFWVKLMHEFFITDFLYFLLYWNAFSTSISTAGKSRVSEVSAPIFYAVFVVPLQLHLLSA